MMNAYEVTIRKQPFTLIMEMRLKTNVEEQTTKTIATTFTLIRTKLEDLKYPLYYIIFLVHT